MKTLTQILGAGIAAGILAFGNMGCNNNDENNPPASANSTVNTDTTSTNNTPITPAIPARTFYFWNGNDAVETNIPQTVYSTFREPRDGVYANPADDLRFYENEIQCIEENSRQDNSEEDDSPIINPGDSNPGNGNSGNSGNSGGWGLSRYSATGIVPEKGAYSFSGGRVRTFDVQQKGLEEAINFSLDNWSFYKIPINKGSFYYRNGLLVNSNEPSDSGRMFPTDGFAISGHFTTPTKAEGKISYSASGRVYSGPLSFSATR